MNVKIEPEENKIVSDSHSLRLNVIIDYFIEKDILINGEIKTQNEIENTNKKKKERKGGKNKKPSKNNKTKTNNEKKKIKNKLDDDNSSYYFSYTIAGKIEGETDIIQYSNSTFQAFHDVEINLEFLKNLYNKQIEVKIWKLIPNNEDKSLSNEYIFRQIKAKKIMSYNRKSSSSQSHMKQLVKPLNNLNSNYKQQKVDNKINEIYNNEMDDDYYSNQSSLINYNFSLIPIKPVYDSLQQLNYQFRNSFQISNYIKNNEQVKNLYEGNKHLKDQQLTNNNYRNNEDRFQNKFNILPNDYIDLLTNTIRIKPHPHHFLIPEKIIKTYRSYSRSNSPIRSNNNNNNSMNKKNKNNLKNNEHIKKNEKNNDYNDYSDSDNYDSDYNNLKNNGRKNRNKSCKIIKKSNKNGKNGENKKITKTNTKESTTKKKTEKDKSKKNKKSKKENPLKRKEDDKYELIGKTTIDICKLFFDEFEVEKILEYPLGEIKHFGFKLSLSEPLLSIKQKRCLNPIAIEIVSAKSMPPKPSTNKINYAIVAPTYCKFSFLESEKEYKCYEEYRQNNNKVVFNSVHLLLSGYIKENELFNYLLYKKLNIEIHDRDYEVPKEKKYISDKFDYIDSYRTTYIPNIIYGLASYSLAPLVTGIKELTLISPVETNFHIKEKKIYIR